MPCCCCCSGVASHPCVPSLPTQLWDDLSVREHLQFYARLKGVKPQEMVAAVQQTAQKVLSLSSA
jgi:ABC-type multidrug transport system ATPase subunit